MTGVQTCALPIYVDIHAAEFVVVSVDGGGVIGKVLETIRPYRSGIGQRPVLQIVERNGIKPVSGNDVVGIRSARDGGAVQSRAIRIVELRLGSISGQDLGEVTLAFGIGRNSQRGTHGLGVFHIVPGEKPEHPVAGVRHLGDIDRAARRQAVLVQVGKLARQSLFVLEEVIGGQVIRLDKLDRKSVV